MNLVHSFCVIPLNCPTILSLTMAPASLWKGYSDPCPCQYTHACIITDY